jgi:hypothetical protein
MNKKYKSSWQGSLEVSDYYNQSPQKKKIKEHFTQIVSIIQF